MSLESFKPVPLQPTPEPSKSYAVWLEQQGQMRRLAENADNVLLAVCRQAEWTLLAPLDLTKETALPLLATLHDLCHNRGWTPPRNWDHNGLMEKLPLSAVTAQLLKTQTLDTKPAAPAASGKQFEIPQPKKVPL